MDILDEIDETIKDKKRKWNYTPMREKSETDALIDELLKEFSSGSSSEQPRSSTAATRSEYDSQPESFERQQYEGSASENQPDRERTRVFSQPEPENDREEIPGQPSDAAPADNSGQQGDDDFDDYDDGLFDDDYYDEDDFNRELSDVDKNKLVGDEFDEFEDYVDKNGEERVRIIQPKQRRSIGRIVWRVFYTAIIAAFTIIGIFSSVIFCLEKIEMMPSDLQKEEEAQKEEISDVLYPFVMTNIDDFESADKISEEQLINLAVWEIIVHGEMKMFADEDVKGYVIPHKQVEYACDKLLGYEKNITPCDITYAGMDIKYNKEKKGYVVPELYDVYTLYPEVTNVSEADGVFTVYVNCFRDTPAWYGSKKQQPAKTMVFTMKKTTDYYNVISAKTVE